MALPKTEKILSATVLILVAASAVYFFNGHESDAALQTTDDAYVQADFTWVAPRIAGQITEVRVRSDEAVVAGQLLAVLDERDLTAALAVAEADVAVAKAQIENLKAQRTRQAALIAQAVSAVDASQAALTLAQANGQRYLTLSADGSGTRQEAQQAEAQARIQKAALARDLAGQSAAKMQIGILGTELTKAAAVQARSEASLANAQLNLSYTRITAPVAGTVGRYGLRQGAYVTVGSPLLALVPLDAVYIEANYRETQLAKVRPGQAAKIRVDTLPGVVLHGRVESLAPASNIAYSPLAPHNATGNFTKVVQRLTVRIALDPNQAASEQLRVGMSVQPSIDTRL